MSKWIKRLIPVAAVLGYLVFGLIHQPQQAIAQIERNGFFFSTNCATFVPSQNFGSPPSGSAVCYDTTIQGLDVWNGTAFVPGPGACNGTVTLAAGVATPAAGSISCLAAITSAGKIGCGIAAVGAATPAGGLGALGCAMATTGALAITQATPAGTPVVNWWLIHK